MLAAKPARSFRVPEVITDRDGAAASRPGLVLAAAATCKQAQPRVWRSILASAHARVSARRGLSPLPADAPPPGSPQLHWPIMPLFGRSPYRPGRGSISIVSQLSGKVLGPETGVSGRSAFASRSRALGSGARTRPTTTGGRFPRGRFPGFAFILQSGIRL
jgi:hypothetical protein